MDGRVRQVSSAMSVREGTAIYPGLVLLSHITQLRDTKPKLSPNNDKKNLYCSLHLHHPSTALIHPTIHSLNILLQPRPLAIYHSDES